MLLSLKKLKVPVKQEVMQVPNSREYPSGHLVQFSAVVQMWEKSICKWSWHFRVQSKEESSNLWGRYTRDRKSGIGRKSPRSSRTGRGRTPLARLPVLRECRWASPPDTGLRLPLC